MLKLVPFNPVWINHDKIDVHAIYRRPRFVEDKYGDKKREMTPAGMQTWDLTGGLPVRRHNDWIQKGYEYVTLASRESLYMAGRAGTILGRWQDYDQHQRGGPWNALKYLEGQEATTTLDAEMLMDDIYEFGSTAVLKLRRRTDPNFDLPPALQNIAPNTPRPGTAHQTPPVDEGRQSKRKGEAA